MLIFREAMFLSVVKMFYQLVLTYFVKIFHLIVPFPDVERTRQTGRGDFQPRGQRQGNNPVKNSSIVFVISITTACALDIHLYWAEPKCCFLAA